MSRLAPLALVVALLASGALAAPPAARASTCADYLNQAAAQRAADTRDADGDGIYCESLPCPCLRPGQNGSGGGEPARRPRLRPSVNLGPVRQRAGCRVRGPLPDRACTPGARFKYATRAKVCRPGYARSVRNVSRATKDAVYRAYGIHRHFNGASGEVDHLVSLELGGSNARSNLFPRGRPSAPRLAREGPPRERAARRRLFRAHQPAARATADRAQLGRRLPRPLRLT